MERSVCPLWASLCLNVVMVITWIVVTVVIAIIAIIGIVCPQATYRPLGFGEVMMLALTRELNLHGVIQTWGRVGEYEMLSSKVPVIVMIDGIIYITSESGTQYSICFLAWKVYIITAVYLPMHSSPKNIRPGSSPWLPFPLSSGSPRLGPSPPGSPSRARTRR